MSTLLLPKKFNVGDEVVSSKPTIFGETTGIIIETDELYRPIDKDGKFIKGSGNIRFESIKNVADITPLGDEKYIVKYNLTGVPITVAFYSHTYMVKLKKMPTAFPEKYLSLKK